MASVNLLQPMSWRAVLFLLVSMLRYVFSLESNNSIDPVRSLLACGPQIEERALRPNIAHFACARTGRTPLHQVAQQGDKALLVDLLEARAHVDAQDFSGQGSLHWAASHGHGSLVDLLLEAGAEPNMADARGRAALHAAAQQGHATSVRSLLLAKAAAFAVDAGGRTALYLAAQYGHYASGKLLIDSRSVATADWQGRTPLHAASLGSAGSDGADGGIAFVQQLLAQRSDVHAKDRWGRTPLHDAARVGAFGAALLLLEAGADPLLPDDNDITPRKDATLFKRQLLVQSFDSAPIGGIRRGQVPGEGRPHRVGVGLVHDKDRPTSAEPHEGRAWTVPRFMRALYPQGIVGRGSNPTRQITAFWHQAGHSILSWTQTRISNFHRLAGHLFGR